MFGSLALGDTKVTNFLKVHQSVYDFSQKMGVSIENQQGEVIIHGKGLHGLNKPDLILDTGNSGTTTRLISGILAGQTFETTLTGDASIQSRPMGRIITPLSQMGAHITSLHDNGCKVPLRIQPGTLQGIHYQSLQYLCSGQILRALSWSVCSGTTTVTEPALSRNHTELMSLSSFGAQITSKENSIQ